jgi:hypothetical protein
MMTRRNNGLRKLCGCTRRNWSKCPHPWHFNFKLRGGKAWRFSLDTETECLSGPRKVLEDSCRSHPKRDPRWYIRAGRRQGKEAPKAATAGTATSPTFATVAGQYAADSEGLAQRHKPANSDTGTT